MPTPPQPPGAPSSGPKLAVWLTLVVATACGPRDGAPASPPTPDELHERARAALVEFERDGRDPASVEAAYGELLRVAPRSPGASLELGTFLVARGDGGRAEPLLRHAVNLAPGDPAALRALGLLMRAKGDLGAAADTLQRALDAGAQDHTTLRALAEALASMGVEPARAAELYLRAAETSRHARDTAGEVHDLVEAARAFRAAGVRDKARAALIQVLALEPGHATAMSELERLDD